MKKRNKIILILLCLVLAVCAVSTIGVLIQRNIIKKNVASQEVLIENGKATASDEAALRELLLKEEDIVITLMEDVTVDETLIVQGNKTLSGTGSIKMALYVMPYENLLTVDKKASLTLDGVTVNGNGIANGIRVEKSANFTLLSGKVAWGNPYGIDVQGNAEIKGGTVTDAIHTGVFIGTSGNAKMSAGNIKAAGYASTRISKGGYFALSDDGILQDCGGYHIHNAGTCDVTGGVVRDSKYTLAANEGEMNIHYQGTDGGMIEWYNAQGSGIWTGEGGSLNASGFYIHDVVYAGVNSGQGIGAINLTNCRFENIDSYGLQIKTATAELKDIEIINVGKHGVYVNAPTTVANIENLTVTEPGERGFHNSGGTVTAKNVTVTSPGTYGVSTGNSGDVKGSVTVENLTVTGAGSNPDNVQPAVNSYKSVLTVNGAKLTDSNGVGARVTDGGILNLTNVEITKTVHEGVLVLSKGQANLKNIKINNAGKHGVYVIGADSKAEIQELTVTKPAERGIHNSGGTVTAKNVTVTSPGTYGVSTGNSGDVKGSVTVENLTVTGAGSNPDNVQPAVNSYKSVLTVTGAKLMDSNGVGARATDGGVLNLTNVEITKTVHEGVLVLTKGQVNLKNIKINNAGKHGVYANGADTKAEIQELTVIKPAERGIHNSGGTVIAKNVTVTSPGTYGVSTGNSGDVKGSVTVENLTVTGAGSNPDNVQPAVNSYKSVLTVNGAKLTDSNGVGARATDGGVLNLTNVEITKTVHEGVLVLTKGQVNLKNIKINNAGKHGVYANGADTKAEIQELTVTKPAERGIHNSGGTVTAKNVIVTSPGTYGVSTGNSGDVKGSVMVENLTVTGAGSNPNDVQPAVNSYKSVLTVTGAKLTDSNGVGARATDGGILNLTNVEILNAGEHGVYVKVGATATVQDLTVTDCAQRGLYAEGGTVIGKKVTTNSTGQYGISAGANTDKESQEVTRATINITDLTVNGTEANAGVMAHNSDVAINGGTITGTKSDGAVAAGTGDLKMTDVSVNSAGRDGVRIEAKCTSTLTGVTVNNATEHGVYAMVGSNVTAKTLTVTDCAQRGLYVAGGTVNAETVTTNSTGLYGISAGASGSTRSTVNITGLTVNGTDANSGIMAHNSDVTINGGTITGTKTDGVTAAGGGALTLTNVSISEAGRNGVQVEKNSTATLTGVEIINAKKHGFYNEGGTVTGENITITTPEIYAVYTVNKDNVKGSVTLTGLSVTGAKVNVAEKDATVADGAVFANNSALTITGTDTAKKIDGSLKNGAGVINGGTLNLNNIEITNAKRHGVYVAVGSTGTANGLTVTDCTERGVYVAGGTFTGTNVTTNSTGQYGISAGAHTDNKTQKVTRATVNITGLTIDGTDDKSGIMAHNSDVTINGGTITGTKSDGAVAAGTGDLKMTDVSVNSAGRDGVRIEAKCTSTLTGVTVNNATEHGVYAMVGSNVTAKTLTVTDCAQRGLYVVGGIFTGTNVTTNSTGQYGISAGAHTDNKTQKVTRATVNITGLTINGTDDKSGIMAHNSDVTINGGTITGTKTDGVTAASSGVANLKDVSISNTERDGVRVETNSTANLTRVKFSNCATNETYKTATSATINVLE